MIDFQQIFFRLPAILVGLVVHELCHAAAALWMGDDTARTDGRLTLNPLKHLDPIGTLLLTFGYFGWAKPVPINPYKFRNRRIGTIVVSLAGPFSNFAIAFISTFALFILRHFYSDSSYWVILSSNFVYYNVLLGVFNLFPIPPLDGSKVVLSLLPEKWYWKVLEVEKFGMVLLIALLYLNVLSPYITGAMQFVMHWDRVIVRAVLALFRM